MRRESRRVIELQWTCPNCQSRNRGPVKTCENCGAPQPADVKFERAAVEIEVTDEQAVAAARAGADIHCGFCGARNPATAAECSQCGADLKEGVAREAGAVLQAAPPQPKSIKCRNCNAENPAGERMCINCGAPLPKAESAPRPAPVQASVSPGLKPKPFNWLLFGGIGAALALCCAVLLAVFFIPAKTLQGTVTDVYWQTSVPVQEVRAVNYSNERGSPPSDAYNVSCHNESREVCETKTIDKGNGYAEEVTECHDETEQYCSYTVDEWKTIQTYDLSGHDLYPQYSQPTVSSGQRVGGASEQYTVTFSTNEGTQTYSPGSLNEFQQFQIGSAWTLQLNVLGSVVSVSR